MQNHSLKQTWVSYGCGGITFNAECQPSPSELGLPLAPSPRGSACARPWDGWTRVPPTESASLRQPNGVFRAPALQHRGKAPVQEANEDKYTICWQSRWLIARGKLNYARSNNRHHGQTPSFVWPVVRHVMEFEFEHMSELVWIVSSYITVTYS